MATIVGHLQARLSATSAAFAADMEKAKRSVKSLDVSFKGLGSTAAMLGGAFGLGFASVQGIISTIKSLATEQIEVVDAAYEVAQRLGIATDTLLAYHHAAKLANVESSQLNGALTRMAKAVAAASGNTRLDSPFMRLGLSARTLAGMSIDKQFESIAEAISKIENPAMRVRAAIDIFGKSGGQLMGVLSGGQAGLKNAVDEFHRLSGVLTEREAANIASMADSIDTLKASSAGLARELTSTVAPALTTLLDAWSALLSSTDSNKGILGGAVANLDETLLRRQRAKSLRGIQEFFGNAPQQDNAAEESLRQAESLEKLIEAQREATNTVGLNRHELAIYRAEMAGASQEQIDEIRRLQEVEDITNRQVESRREAAKAVEDQAKAVKDYIAALEEELKTVGMSAAELAAHRAEVAGATPADIERAKSIADAIDARKSEIADSDRAKADASATMDRMKGDADVVRQSIRTPTEELHDEITRLESLRDAGLLTEAETMTAIDKARSDIMPTQQGGIGAGGAASLGSSEAASIILRSMNMPGAAKAPEEKTAKNTEEIKKNGVKQAAILERVAINTAPLANLVTVEF